MIERIHHINFIVRDLDAAMARYRVLFGEPAAETEVLPQREVRLARFRVGETWLILVQPLDQDSVPARFLAEHGEGFFLLSGQVDDITKAVSTVSAAGLKVADEKPRQGLDDWRVIDLDSIFGATFQLVESSV